MCGIKSSHTGPLKKIFVVYTCTRFWHSFYKCVLKIWIIHTVKYLTFINKLGINHNNKYDLTCTCRHIKIQQLDLNCDVNINYTGLRPWTPIPLKYMYQFSLHRFVCWNCNNSLHWREMILELVENLFKNSIHSYLFHCMNVNKTLFWSFSTEIKQEYIYINKNKQLDLWNVIIIVWF